MGEPVPRWRVLKLRFFNDQKREFPGKNEISGPHCGQKWGPEAVEPSFSPGKTAEKKRNFKKRQQGCPLLAPSRRGLVCCSPLGPCPIGSAMNPFVFLVGCPRSGTTLLQRVV